MLAGREGRITIVYHDLIRVRPTLGPATPNRNPS